MRHLLLNPGASITIADEGHTIKNAEAKISIAVSKIETTARVILTGYPLQNRLEEYWCMVDFVWPNYLGDLQTFKHNYIRPIQGGLYPDSSSTDKKVKLFCLKVLTELIKHFVMRRDQSILRATLPKKVEFVISCKLTPMQYDFVANSFKMKILIDILVECKRIKEKVLVYSRSIPTLGKLQHLFVFPSRLVFVVSVTNAALVHHCIDFVEHLLNTMGSFRFLRMDGQTAVSDRQGMINHFNAKEYDLFLVSSGSGSQGINLVSANRVVIIDVGWNPSIDEQSVARAFRYGQTRKVFVYRLQTHGTFESKVYKNNLQKLSLANRVV
ncbi:MAG: P-loop containing nucleoside triphosphate hydrolase protein, partial [Podila humilis]